MLLNTTNFTYVSIISDHLLFSFIRNRTSTPPMSPNKGDGTPSKAAAAAFSSMALQPVKKLDLSSVSVDDSLVKSMVEKSAENDEEKDSGFTFLVSGTGVYNASGSSRAGGCITLVDNAGNVFWAFKAQAVALALAVIVNSTSQLGHLRELVASFQSVPMRRHVNGGNTPKTVKGKKGGEFNIDILLFQIDVTGTLHGPDRDLSSRIQDLHQIMISTHFTDAYIKCMKEMPKLEKLAATIDKENNPVWMTFAKCNLTVDMPAPLSQYLMDDEIRYIMKYVTKKEDKPSTWTEDERHLAYLNGRLPGTLLSTSL